ncbi:hypothetical protein WR25_12292 [Diploscapter pachys]|uniref:G-protein coupled receptors family 1 profile domain-containing protein n=1 Tax=Diploscapter pachys TaxID=2018661 RepID=A0A2A2JVA2_9BILA|nr:hypothetical protein WR25_12292 [Diploscapter pachys]
MIVVCWQLFMTKTMNGTIPPHIQEQVEFTKAVYTYLIPVMIVILLFAIIGNGIIVLAAPYLSKPISPYLKLCVSLAAADMWAASLLICGLVVNSFLPVVLGQVRTTQCPTAYLEMFRIAGMLTSDLHLFALAINQFFGTYWPLKYKIMVTTRRIRLIILGLWVIPIIFVAIWFVQDPYDGLRHPACVMQFYNRLPFRVTIFLTFMLPLITTLLIYGLILSKLLKARAEFEMSVNERKLKVRRSNVQSKLKLVWTTLLIVSTFSLSWGACVLYFVLVCNEGCLFIYKESISFYLGMFLGSTVNFLVMLKLAVNPFIYTLRIKAIRSSVDNFFNAFCRRRNYEVKLRTDSRNEYSSINY